LLARRRLAGVPAPPSPRLNWSRQEWEKQNEQGFERHSYGGVVITEAGNDPKVSALVYIAAFAPDAGQSVGSLGASADGG
jgi:hypothetical protein